MRKNKILLIVIAVLIVFYLFYTKSASVSQMYPYLDLSKADYVYGYYNNTPELLNQRFQFEKGTEEYKQIVNIFSQTKFSKSISNLFPQGGTKVHRYSKGDFMWEVNFVFEESIQLKDGSTASGNLIYFKNFYGDLEYMHNGSFIQCTVKNQNDWLKSVMNIILV